MTLIDRVKLLFFLNDCQQLLEAERGEKNRLAAELTWTVRKLRDCQADVTMLMKTIEDFDRSLTEADKARKTMMNCKVLVSVKWQVNEKEEK